MAENIVNYFQDEKHIELLNKLKSYGVNPISSDIIVDTKFVGKTFVLTGTLESFTREEASAIIESLGGKTSSSVSKKTSYVLAGEQAGSKLEKAKTLGIKIITESEFKELIK